MSKPTIRNSGGVYILEWENNLRFRIDRLREDSRHQVTGEVLVQGLDSGTPQHLHQARLNLVSTNARRTLAKHLLEVTRDEATGWAEIVEQACCETLDAYRQGEPIIRMNDVGPREGSNFRLFPLLVEGHPNMIYGYGGSGKSYLASLFSVLISSGIEHCNLTPIRGRVLYLDYETSAVELRERLTLIENGLDRPGCSDILYRFCCQPLAAEVDDLQRHISDNDVSFIVVDSLGMASGGDPRQTEFTTAYYRALRSLNRTSLTLHHKAKAQDSKGPYGDVYIANYARSVWELKAVAEPGEPVVQMGLFHYKTNFGPLLKPLGFSAHFRDADVVFNTSDVREVPGLRDSLGVKERILAVLRMGAMDAESLADETGAPITQIRVRLSELHKAGKVVNLEGEWGLTAHEE